ncbi:BON domain-containing protein [Pseudobacteriovorax antillogorgiicola]|uniref:BON domain-containing protein n=1 Tax=Pseudobacteriovorax antillogorgiicola TaxID=1513793 RepID=A0A1Y6BR22_9BACT|nr:BON domain-containing protein [Pseudobacteriovorax antillogorgiicola]TCS53746.1 BON domain-containing protein [Pseudobacteriovorax antillogorgiicola]SMF22632.1 BON domain-containing protein [Pseudobacteriovorax antillogorgiicola]
MLDSYPSLSPESQLAPEIPGLNKERKPDLYLIGDRKKSRDLALLLNGLDVNQVWIPDVRDIRARLSPTAISVIFVEPMVGLIRGIKMVKKSGLLKNIPIHVVTSNSCPDKLARTYYRLGASSVVSYPEEKFLVQDIVQELHQNKADRASKMQPEGRFRRAMWARLKAVVDHARRFRLKCRDGVVYLAGQASSRRQKEKIEEVLRDAPGVERIVHGDFRVSAMSDQELLLTQKIDDLLLATEGVAEQSVAYEVYDGEVVITGHVSSKRAMKQLEKAIKRLEGVHRVRNLISISRQQAITDQNLAKTIESRLRRFCHQSSIGVKVMKNIAVLNGSVDDSGKRRLAENVAKQYGQIQAVVNRLDISQAQGS